MKRLKIRGITGMPLFIVRFHGRLDGKRNVVAFKDGKWEGHYLQKKEAIFHSFVHRTYRELEEKTSQLHKESVSLAVEYHNILEQLTKPDPIPSGGTNSSQARQKARAATIEPTLRDRKRTIKLNMAGIEEDLIQNIVEAGAIQREAAALTERRIHAYLHGATLAARAVNFPVEYTVPVLLSNEESYREKHLWNDNGAVDKIPFPPNYATIRGKGGGGMQLKFHTVTIEDLMPQDHFLRRLEAALDLSFVRVETAHLYSRRYGRPPIDPVVLVKYLLVGFLYGIPSERQIEQRIQTDVALRWYLGLDLFDRVPDHSTISQLRRRKPSFRKIFRRLFEEVVGQCVAKGLASGRLVGTDSTHVKANASWASEELVELPESPGVYWERLDTYEEEGLEELERRTGKRRKKRVKQIKKDRRQTRKWVSRTDPESGHMKRPGKPRGQHYLAHQTVDTDCGVILDVTVTPGDVYDSVPYLEQIERIHRSILPIQAATADAAYDFPLAHQALKELEIQFFVRPQAVHDRTNVELKREAFQYDESLDAYVCPNGKLLRLNTLHRSASGLYWLYLADKQDCQRCPLRKKCLSQQDKRGARKLEHSYFTAQRKRNLSRLSDPIYREALKKRQIWCEGTFAAQKRGHNLTQILRRGLEAAEDHCLLSATALNLKRMIWAMK